MTPVSPPEDVDADPSEQSEQPTHRPHRTGQRQIIARLVVHVDHEERVSELDSGALDLEAVMKARHFALYDDAFGDDPAYWAQLSPLRQLSSNAPPVLALTA